MSRWLIGFCFPSVRGRPPLPYVRQWLCLLRSVVLLLVSVLQITQPFPATPHYPLVSSGSPTPHFPLGVGDLPGAPKVPYERNTTSGSSPLVVGDRVSMFWMYPIRGVTLFWESNDLLSVFSVFCDSVNPVLIFGSFDPLRIFGTRDPSLFDVPPGSRCRLASRPQGSYEVGVLGFLYPN